jgi:hypothetical protein
MPMGLPVLVVTRPLLTGAGLKTCKPPASLSAAVRSKVFGFSAMN